MEAGVDGTTATINWECTLRGFDSLFRMLGPIYTALTFEIERAANPRYGIQQSTPDSDVRTGTHRLPLLTAC